MLISKLEKRLRGFDNKTEIKIDTIQENGQTYILKKQEFYGEKINDKELKIQLLL